MAKKKDGAAATQDAVLELPVSYSNVNIGDKTVRVGVAVSRANLTSAQADRTLCGKRLKGTIIARAGGAQAEQTSLPGADNDVSMEGTFDVTSIVLRPKQIGFGLTFNREQISIETIADFAKREGIVKVYEVSKIPEEEQAEEQAEE